MPKPYRRKMPATWWLKHRNYFWFMMRELSAVFVAEYCVILMLLVWRLKQGPAEFDELLVKLKTPWSIAFHFFAFVFAVYHSVTWFNLLPKVIVLRKGEEKVPGVLLAGTHYIAWFAVSAVLILVVF